MNIDKIKNSTLAKLDKCEIGELGLCNYGVGLYRGELKSRKRGFKTIHADDGAIFFDGSDIRFEFVRIQSETLLPEYAARIFNKDACKYETYPMGISGCDFFK